MNKKIIAVSLIILILLFHKLIIFKFTLSAFEKWVKKDIKIEKFDILYSQKKIVLNGVNVLNNNNNFYKKVFFAEEIEIIFQPKSIISNLILIDSLVINNPVMNINFKIFNEKEEIIDDNIGVLKNLKNKNNPKIYPKKITDINFLIMKMNLENFKINIFRSDLKKEININSSNFNFAPFGNEKGYQHYKDIFRFILVDIIMQIPDMEFRNKVIERYNIK